MFEGLTRFVEFTTHGGQKVLRHSYFSPFGEVRLHNTPLTDDDSWFNEKLCMAFARSQYDAGGSNLFDMNWETGEPMPSVIDPMKALFP